MTLCACGRPSAMLSERCNVCLRKAMRHTGRRVGRPSKPKAPVVPRSQTRVAGDIPAAEIERIASEHFASTFRPQWRHR